VHFNVEVNYEIYIYEAYKLSQVVEKTCGQCMVVRVMLMFHLIFSINSITFMISLFQVKPMWEFTISYLCCRMWWHGPT